MEGRSRDSEIWREGAGRNGWRCRGSLSPASRAFSKRSAVFGDEAHGEDHAVSCA